jgi:hypothetical protein
MTAIVKTLNEDIFSEQGYRPPVYITQDSRFRPWLGSREIVAVDPGPTSALVPADMVIALKGANELKLIVSQPHTMLNASGTLDSVTDWSGRLWLGSMPGSVIYWGLQPDSDFLGMGSDPMAARFDVAGFEYAAFQVYNFIAAKSVWISWRLT